MAYVLLCALRRIALQNTQFAKPTCGMIRLKLLKLGALVRISVRRVKFAMASGCPDQRDFARAHAQLTNRVGGCGRRQSPPGQSSHRAQHGRRKLPRGLRDHDAGWA